MSGTAVQQDICGACGTEIRDQALFCYHCGESVEAIDQPIPMPEAAPKLKKGKKPPKSRRRAAVSPVESEESLDDSQEPTTAETDKNGKRELNLRSAASLRNKARRVEAKKVEIYWEEHESAPNTWFVVVSLLIVLFAVVIFVIAMYLK